MVERKYIVLSISDVEKFLKDEEKVVLANICERLEAGRNHDLKPPLDGIFIDKSWGDVYEGAKNLLTESLHNTVKPLKLTNNLDSAVNDDNDGFKVGDTIYFTRDESIVTGRKLGDTYKISQVRSTGISIKFVSGHKPNPVYMEDTVSKKCFNRFWSFTNPLFEGVKVGVQIEPTHTFSCRKPGEVYEITAVDEGSITYKYVGGGDKPPLRLIGFTGRSWFFERWKVL